MTSFYHRRRWQRWRAERYRLICYLLGSTPGLRGSVYDFFGAVVFVALYAAQHLEGIHILFSRTLHLRHVSVDWPGRFIATFSPLLPRRDSVVAVSWRFSFETDLHGAIVHLN